jgi:hypothetical protein
MTTFSGSLADRVWESCSGNCGSSGNFILNGPLQGYQSFGSGVAPGSTVPYFATDSVNWETGLGIWSGGQIQRSTVYESNNANTNVNFSGANLSVSLDVPSAIFNSFLTGISSGQIQSGQIAAGAVNAINLASGVGGSATITSGAITSGMLGNASVVAGSIASGVIPASFALTSGIITSGYLGNASVTSGNIASGAIGASAIASGVIPTIPPSVLVSGAIQSGMIANGAVVAGSIASGVIPASFVLSSGIVQSGELGAGSVNTINITAGAVGLTQLGSGVTFPQQNTVYTPTAYNAGETIASGMPLSLTASGYMQAAMASIATRMPAFAITPVPILSGAMANPLVIGKVYQGSAAYSGTIGQPVYVGRSGGIVWASGGLNSGGFQSGDIVQALGVADSASGSFVTIGDAFTYGGIVIASGSIAQYQLASGVGGNSFTLTSGIVTSGFIGVGAVTSGNIASGVITQAVIGSGFQPSYFGTTTETVSGCVAMCFNSGGFVQVAMAAQPLSRMPAAGLNLTNALSGQVIQWSPTGFVQSVAAGTGATFSGAAAAGARLWVGASGQITTKGAFGSFSGALGQCVGMPVGSGFFWNMNPAPCFSGGPVSLPGNF